MTRLGAGAVHVLAFGLALLALVVVGQPLYANDTWIHLALGEVFAAQGPWLAADPFLFLAPGPPSPSSWLGSVAIFEVSEIFGFAGLRVAHVLVAALIFGLAWRVLRQASQSAAFASFGLTVFILVSAYRVVQLRPHLFTMAALLAIYLWVLAPSRGPRLRAGIAASALTAIWANVHAAFLLGPILVLGSAAFLAILGWVPALGGREEDRDRARPVSMAGVAMLLASLLNPEGIRAHAAYFLAGGETSGLGSVVDEWGPTQLFALPAPGLPPSLAAWVVAWLALVGVVAALGRLWLDRSAKDDQRAFDPVLLALSIAALAASIMATRFLWLLIFPLALLGAWWMVGSRDGTGAAHPRFSPAWLLLPTVLAIALQLIVGDAWTISRTVRSGGVPYADPYPAAKFAGHATWFLADAEVEGQIYNAYPLGGFMSYWLGPKLQMASSGTMNVERESMDANYAIRGRHGLERQESFAALLDRQGFDLFLATGLPTQPSAGRPVPSTLRHMEGEADWMLVYRSLSEAVYLRRGPANRANLNRIRKYYQAAGVPFDLQKGLDIEAAITRSPEWAVANGLVPWDLPELLGVAREAFAGRAPEGSRADLHRLADLYAVLGLYDHAIRMDVTLLNTDSQDATAAGRLLWSMVQLNRFDQALELVEAYQMGSNWSRAIAGWRMGSPEDQRRAIVMQPLLDELRAHVVRGGIEAPLARTVKGPQKSSGRRADPGVESSVESQ